MQITMDDSRITTVAQLGEFLKASQKVVVSLEEQPIEEKYLFIEKTIKQFSYNKLAKKEKRTVYGYLRKVTGYKKRQLYRLITKAQQGTLKRTRYIRVKPHHIYTGSDIKLLEKTDELHLRLSEDATKEILRREYVVFGKQEYQTIARISHSHITNLRHSPIYKSSFINRLSIFR